MLLYCCFKVHVNTRKSILRYTLLSSCNIIRPLWVIRSQVSTLCLNYIVFFQMLLLDKKRKFPTGFVMSKSWNQFDNSIVRLTNWIESWRKYRKLSEKRKAWSTESESKTYNKWRKLYWSLNCHLRDAHKWRHANLSAWVIVSLIHTQNFMNVMLTFYLLTKTYKIFIFQDYIVWCREINPSVLEFIKLFKWNEIIDIDINSGLV